MIKLPDPEVIARFRDIVAERFGLHFDDTKQDFLGEVLLRRIGQTGSGDAFWYLQRLTSGAPSHAEMAALAEELTVGETYFFRHPDQFRAFTEVVLLPQLQSPGTSSRLRILSAGCASGEEAYSLAILIRQYVPEVSHWDARVIGIDINSVALAKATKARYTSWSLRGVPDEIRRRYFRVADKGLILDDSVRALVPFEERNLLDDAPEFWQADQFDVIFCRNVVMYFTAEATQAVIARLTHSLVPGGFLFLGPAETLRGISHDYHLRHTHGTFYYQRRLAGEGPAKSPAAGSAASPSPGTYVPVLPAIGDSWVGAIGQASERISQLSREIADTGSSVQKTEPSPSAVGQAGPKESFLLSIQAAREMLRQERFEDALGVLHTLSREEEQDPDVQLLRAVILTNRGQVAEADQLCRQVLTGDELNAEAHYLLALCREHERDYAMAIEHDQTAVYLDSQFAMPYLHLGLVNKRMGNLAAADRAFRQAHTLLPREDASRILLLGGGFSREMLLQLCREEIRACGGAS
jgi:chemotaxis protein methyltransferase CheR